MAILPQITDPVGVARPNAPTRGGVSLGRVQSGASAGAAALGAANRRAVGSLRGPGASADLFGAAQGEAIAGLGNAVSRVGETLFAIRERKARADNYSAVAAARNEMLRVEGEFDKWRLENPDPSQWEARWSDTFSNFRNNYGSGRDLSPAAQEAIALEMDAWGTRQTVQVGVAAVKGSVARARSANEANYLRYIEEENLPGVERELEIARSEGWMYEDESYQKLISARERIEGKRLQRLGHESSALIDRGQFDEAANLWREVRDSGGLPREEADARLADVEKQRNTYGIAEAIWSDADKDLEGTIARLQSRDENGNFADYEGFPIDQRKRFTQALKTELAKLHQEDVGDLITRYRNGLLDDQTIQEEPKYKGLPEALQGSVLDSIRKDALNDHFALEDFREQVAEQIDPREGDAEEIASRLLTQASLQFQDDMLEQARGMVSDRMENPDPLEPDPLAKSETRSYWKDRILNEDFGRFSFTRNEIKQIEHPTEGLVFAVEDPNPPEALGFKSKKNIFGFGGKSYRKIDLHTEDQRLWHESSDIENDRRTYTDQIFYRHASDRWARTIDSVEKDIAAGEIEDSQQYSDRFADYFGVSRAQHFESIRKRSENEPEEIQGVPGSGGYYGPDSASLFPAGATQSAAAALREKYPNL